MTRKGKQLTRKVGVNFYGFIFLLQRIFLGNFGTKNVLPIRRKHYRLAALLHDVFRKPHRQKVSLKPKQKTRTSRFLSTLRFLFGTPIDVISELSAISFNGSSDFEISGATQTLVESSNLISSRSASSSSSRSFVEGVNIPCSIAVSRFPIALSFSARDFSKCPRLLLAFASSANIFDIVAAILSITSGRFKILSITEFTTISSIYSLRMLRRYNFRPFFLQSIYNNDRQSRFTSAPLSAIAAPHSPQNNLNVSIYFTSALLAALACLFAAALFRFIICIAVN